MSTVSSIESRANQRRESNSEMSSPVREVLNSALSLAAVIGITVVGTAVLNRLFARHSS